MRIVRWDRFALFLASPFIIFISAWLILSCIRFPSGRERSSVSAASSLPSVSAGIPSPVPKTENDPCPAWNLILVNRDHPVNENDLRGIRLTRLRNGQSVDERCYPELQQMMDDCRAAGFSPVICSSFRTRQKQEELFARQVETYRQQGMSPEAAREKTKESIAIPGTSEHELGLAVDITDTGNQHIISGTESQPVQRWLASNCWKYGFILRYPPDKAQITGIVYEPWHFRYVGKEAAAYITEHHLTLEEYLLLFPEKGA